MTPAAGAPNVGWTRRGSGAAVSPGCQSTPPGRFCRAVIGHPEFSTSTRMYVSYFDPSVNAPYDNGYNAPGGVPEGHLRVAQLPY
jgi:hypothetical protein